MTEEIDVGTAETQPADDLRSALAAAFTESETSAVEPAETPAKPVASETTTETTETRARTPDGKFAKKADTETNAEPAETTAAAEPKEGEEAAAPEATEPPKEEDKHAALLKPWKAGDQEMFKKLAPDAQEFLSRRYKEMEGDYTKKLQANARLRTEYEPIDKMFEPHREAMKQKGFTPAGLIEAWSNVEKKLNNSPEDAAGVIAAVRGYNVPGPVLARALGIAPPARPAAQQTDGAAPDNPQTNGAAAPSAQLPQEFLTEFGQIKQAIHGLTADRQAEIARAKQIATAKAQQDIESFKSETDKDGTLLPLYGEVEQDMLDLANIAIAAGKPVPSLSQLYEKAVGMDPARVEKLLTARVQAEEAKRIAQDKAKAAAARKASASVTGAPGSGQATASRAAPERSLREELESNMAENA